MRKSRYSRYSSIFDLTGAYKPKRNMFNLSHSKRFDADEGYIYPILFQECVPGDTWKIGYDMVARIFNPLVAPVMQACNVDVRYFFIPTRLMFRKEDLPEGSEVEVSNYWAHFLSQGQDGMDDSLSLPRWQPSTSAGYAVHSLWDYFGLPTGIQPASDYCPLSFCKRAYNLVYNNFYRAEDLIDEIDMDSDVLQKCAWNKDYFTTAAPWQQRGQSPALPFTVSGKAFVQYDSAVGSTGFANSVVAGGTTGNKTATDTSSTALIGGSGNPALYSSGGANSSAKPLYVSGDNLTTTSFNISDLRLAFQIQRFMEASATGGVRYTEFLRRMFAVAPRDERLQIPEFIGGGKSPLIVSEVLQTSGTQGEGGTQLTAQGNLAGHGMVAGSQYICTYHVQEFGYVLGLLFIRPKASYCQGINRQFLRRTRYDFYFPQFAHLSEQAIETAEIYAQSGEAHNGDIFGYQGRYNELRSCPDIICGDLRGTLSYWHQGRIFTNVPVLNQSFIECDPSKRIFAVQEGSTSFVFNFGNVLHVVRPLPSIPTPGMMDHN